MWYFYGLFYYSFKQVQPVVTTIHITATIVVLPTTTTTITAITLVLKREYKFYLSYIELHWVIKSQKNK